MVFALTEEFEISVMLPRRARAHRCLLRSVDATPALHERYVLLNAVRRYETHWLPLIARYDGAKVSVSDTRHRMLPLAVHAKPSSATDQSLKQECFGHSILLALCTV